MVNVSYWCGRGAVAEHSTTRRRNAKSEYLSTPTRCLGGHPSSRTSWRSVTRHVFSLSLVVNKLVCHCCHATPAGLGTTRPMTTAAVCRRCVQHQESVGGNSQCHQCKVMYEITTNSVTVGTMTIVSPWLYCPHDCIVPMTVLFPWLYCPHDCIVSMIVLSPWLYCSHDCIVPMTVLFPWLYCPRDCIVPMTVLSPWLYCSHDCIVPMTVLFPWLYCPHDCIVPMTVLSPWLYCSHDCIVPVIVLSPWLYCPHDCIVPMTVVSTWLVSLWLYCHHDCTVTVTVVKKKVVKKKFLYSAVSSP